VKRKDITFVFFSEHDTPASKSPPPLLTLPDANNTLKTLH
jgi:hypothetical protein